MLDEEKIEGMTSLGYSKKDAEIFVRANGKCEYCGLDLIENRLGFDAVQFDHIIPKSKGGSDDIDNIAFSCQICNTAKHTYVPEGNCREDRILNAKTYILNKREYANGFWQDVKRLLRG